MNCGLVIIPTYNEIENIKDIIDAVFALPKPFHLLIVDDNSPDKTHEKVKELQAIYPNLFLEVRTKKAGLGTAYIHGFKWALARNYDFIYEMDADFSHNPNDLVKLHEASANYGADMAVGSRYVKGVNVVNWPLSRVLLSYFASFYVKMITGMKIFDATAGFVCYRKEVLQAINLNKVQFVGYAFQIEMKYRVYCKKFNIQEVPIIFTDRTKGVSKMNYGIIKEAVFGVILLKIKRIFKQL
jgi:dolichol-phosphate mannosyltransferase